MTLPLRSEVCLYCKTPLVRDPDHSEWSHCPTCSPAWTNAIANRHAFDTFKSMRAYAADPRGRPHRRPA